MSIRHSAAVGAAILAIALAGCSSTPEVTSAPSAEAAAEPSAPAPSAVETPAPEEGTRDNPMAVGSSRLIAEGSAWTVGITASNLDGAATLAAANSWAPRPAEGERFVIATLSVSVSAEAIAAQGFDLASEGAMPSASISLEFVGNDGISYDELSGTACYTDTPFYNTGTLYNDGATVSGDFCIAVPAGVVDGGLWRVSNPVNEGVWIQIQ